MAFDHEGRMARLEERQTMTEATVAELTEAVTTLTSAFNAYAADTNQTIADILAKEAQGGTITGAELGPIKDSLATLTADVAAADAIVKADDPGQAPAAPDKPVYIHDVEGPTEGWTASGFEVPAVPAVAEVPAVPANTETGAAEVPAVPAVAEVPAKPLFYFDADAVGGAPTGEQAGVWTVYTGPVQAVPAA
jgi:uncharacterized coiled-coil protein SlyX